MALGSLLRFSLATWGALWLNACGTLGDAQGARSFRTIGNASTVTVWGADNEASARPFAERHCEAYGKTARFLRVQPTRVSRFTTVDSIEFQCA